MYDGPLLCGFHVAIKGLRRRQQYCTLVRGLPSYADCVYRTEAGDWRRSGDHQTQEELHLRHQSSRRLRQLFVRDLHRLRRSASTIGFS